MDKNKVRKIILILLIIFIVLLIILLAIMPKIEKKYFISDDEYIFPVTDENILAEVEDYKQYFTVTNIIATYYGYIGERNEDAVKSILDNGYFGEHTIQDELKKVESIEPIFYTDKMYVQTNDVQYIYYVHGNLKNYLNDIQSKEIYLEVYLDNSSNSFDILPIDANKYENAVSGKELSTLKEIKSNEYNAFSYVMVSDMTKATTIFNNYKQIISSDIEKAYDMLDEEYREKKFGSIEGYKEFLNSKQLTYSILKEYNVTEKKDYAQYSCIDQNGNQYIFKETGVMEYTVLLDNYTIVNDEFIQKYNNLSEQQKVALNIEKFIQAINDKSYHYAYNCLADSFKNNYFKEEMDFETYAKENFYADNNVTYNSFEKQGELYTYSVILTDKETGAQKNKTFIMQLKEGTDFVLSFDR